MNANRDKLRTGSVGPPVGEVASACVEHEPTSGRFVRLLLIGLLVVLVTEEAALGHLSRISATAFVVMKMLTTVVLLILFVWMVVFRFRALRVSPVGFKALGLFVATCMCSAIINGVSVMAFVSIISTLLRYIVLLFLISPSFGFDRQFLRRLLGVIIALALLESGLTFLQEMFPAFMAQVIPMSEGLAVGEGNIAGFAQEKYWQAWPYGTLGRFNNLGAFLFFSWTIVFAFAVGKKQRNRILYVCAAVVIIFAMVLTRSRSSLLASACAGIVIVMLHHKRAVALYWSVFVVASAIAVWMLLATTLFAGTEEGSVTHRIASVFWADQLDAYRTFGAGRLYYIRYFVGDVFSYSWLKGLLGFGPGALGSKAIYVFGSDPLSALGISPEAQPFILDVQWAYLFGQVGLVGVSLFVVFLFQIGRRLWTNIRDAKDTFQENFLKGAFAAFWGMIALGFFSPVLEIRTSSYLFWLLVATAIHLHWPTASAKAAETPISIGKK